MNEKINNQENKEKMSLKSILAWIGIYVLVFAIFLMGSLFCVRAFDKNYRYYPVKGTSMQPIILKTILKKMVSLFQTICIMFL